MLRNRARGFHMFKGTEWNQIIIAVLALGILVLSGYMVYTNNTPYSESTLTVTGDAKISVEPNKVEVYLSAETRDISANVSQQENARIMEAVRSALADLGIGTKDIETTSYNLYPIYEYDKNGSLEFQGYRTTQSIKIISFDLSKTGSIADAAVSAGANRVDNIIFGITDDRLIQLKAQVVNMSIDDAKTKALAQSSRIGARIVKVKQLSESSYYYPVYKSSDYISAAPTPSTEISPGQVDVSATVNVIYQIE